MNDLSLDYINTKSPYLVKRADDGDFELTAQMLTEDNNHRKRISDPDFFHQVLKNQLPILPNRRKIQLISGQGK
jgi:hypothetical protein